MLTQLSSKGQVTLPKVVRESHHWVSGTQFTIEEQDDGVLLRPTANAQMPPQIQDLVGCLNYHGPAKTIDEMNAAVMEEARKHTP